MPYRVDTPAPTSLHANKPKPDWKRIIDEKEKRERDELEAKFREDQNLWDKINKQIQRNF